MDDKLARVKTLIEQREAIDAELSGLIVGYNGRKQQKCSSCGSTDHNARACPTRSTTPSP